MDHDWRCGAATAGFRSEDGSRADQMDSSAGCLRPARIRGALRWQLQLAAGGDLCRGWDRRDRAAREAAVGAAFDVGRLALPVSADLAFLSHCADRVAVVCASGISGTLHDLLPAGAGNSGCCGAGGHPEIVAAGSGSLRRVAAWMAGSIFRLRTRL